MLRSLGASSPKVKTAPTRWFLASQALRDDLEVVEFVVELHVTVNGFLTVLVAHIRVFEADKYTHRSSIYKMN